ncbi:MAG: hypothetical protein DRP65_07005 [Planctomycetota bacterium]|nr:MAG: hypothetical protein DRP65_07005 [Planctomycetota bacterium]
MKRFTKIKIVSGRMFLLVFLFAGGCGIAPVSLRYAPTGNVRRITTSFPKVNLQVKDDREKKVFFRTILGENDDAGKNGVLRLITPPKKVFEEGFTQALQSAGYQVRNYAEIVYEVHIKRFLAIDRESTVGDLDSDIMFEVLIKKAGKLQAKKTFFQNDSVKQKGVWQHAIPPFLNNSLSHAIEKAVVDPMLTAAVCGSNIGRPTTAKVKKPTTVARLPKSDNRVKVEVPAKPSRKNIKRPSIRTENFTTINIKEKSAEAKLVDKEVSEIMKGRYGKLPPMQKISSGGKRQYSAINIHNDTRYNLTVRYSGLDSCKVTFMPKEKGCVQVLNGDYKVAASVDAVHVADYAGTAKLDGGNFEVTYYISTTGPYGVNIPRISPPRIYYGGAPAFKPWPMKRSVSQ